MPRMSNVVPAAARAALALACAWCATAPLFAAPLFPGRQHEVGLTPLGLAAGDFDGDGRVDLATANEQSGDVTVLLGRGSDDFAPAQRLAAGLYPSALAAADFDADGRLDLAAANSGSDEVFLYAGRGDGTFAAPSRFATGTGPVALAVADLDGDHRLDLMTANAYSDDLSILAGIPGGGFAPERRLGLGAGPLSIAPVDLDGDGAVDLVVALWISEQIAFLRNRGDGTFHPPVRTRLSEAPAVVRAADFDRDGRPDVALALQDGRIQVLGGDGTGGLRDPRTVADVGGPPAALEVVRLDAGPVPDLVVAAGSAVLLYGRGNGTFEAPLRCGGLFGPAALAAGDVDRDGVTDLVFTTRSSDSPGATSLDAAAVLLGRDNGACVGPVVSEEFDGRWMAVADFDGDRRLDAVTVEGEQEDLVLRRGRGDGGFKPSEPITASAGRGRLLAADFDLDGRMDLAQTRNTRDEVSIRLGRGDGTFAPAVTFGTVDAPWDMAAGQIDGDRFPDLVVTSDGLRNVAVLPGRGDGTFGPPTLLRAGVAPTGTVISDLDGDGKNDLLVLNFGDDDLAFFRGHGDGGFDPPQFLGVGGFPTSLALRPLGDGRADVVIGHGRGHIVSVVRGLGDGLFAVEDFPLFATAPWVVAVDDLDRDGRPDIVSGNRDTGNISFLSGASAAPAVGGSPATRMTFGAGAEPRDLAIGDFDNDGRKDVLVLLATGLAVLLNESADPGGPAVVDFTLRPAALPGTFALSWRTIAESDVAGFRLVAVSRTGAVAAGEVRADCRECDTGFGATYNVLLPRAPQGRLYYLDVLHQDGTTERFGPAVKSPAGRSAGAGRGGASPKQEKTRPHAAPPAP